MHYYSYQTKYGKSCSSPRERVVRAIQLALQHFYDLALILNICKLEMWANAQRDGRHAEHKWRPLFNAEKFGWRSLSSKVNVTLRTSKDAACHDFVNNQND